MTSLNSIRQNIEKVDKDILTLVAQRLELSKQALEEKVRATKSGQDIHIRYPAREQEILRQAVKKAEEKGIAAEDVAIIIKQLIQMSIEVQRELLKSKYPGMKELDPDASAKL